jgi:PTS system nitrogen regulatory IIA component
MRVSDLIPKKAIVPELKAKDKKGVIAELVKAVKAAGGGGAKFSVSEVTHAILEREKLGSTGIGRGVAIPHAKSKHLTKVIGALGRAKQGLAFDAIDGEPVDLFFLILSPQNASEEYHQALQSVMLLLKKGSFMSFLRNAKGVKDMEEILRDAEEPIKV